MREELSAELGQTEESSLNTVALQLARAKAHAESQVLLYAPLHVLYMHRCTTCTAVYTLHCCIYFARHALLYILCTAVYTLHDMHCCIYFALLCILCTTCTAVYALHCCVYFARHALLYMLCAAVCTLRCCMGLSDNTIFPLTDRAIFGCSWTQCKKRRSWQWPNALN